nr:cadherin domain-containing protein [Microvirga puerhi]
MLGLLTFDATEHTQAGSPITTQFTITLDDGHHAFPASNTEVKVVTTVTGPTGQNNLYYIVDGTETFHNEVPGPEGGFDIAYVKYTGGHYTLADNDGIEVLQAYDTNTAGIDVAGNNLSNTIIGGAFNDTLDGGSAGQDVLRGGKGDDTYVVSRDGVIIEEDTTETGGIDTVKLTGNFFANGGYTLGQFLENLDASATTGVMTLNGNELGNAITGNADSNILQGFDGNDTLDGGAGSAADVLKGGSGNDTYKIRHASDAIVEGDGDSFDVAEIYLHEEYRLKADAQVEVLRAGEGFTQGVHLIGNAYSSFLLGSGSLAVSDTLDGGTGVGIAHLLAGGDGNDTYYIVNVNDEIEGERDLEDSADNGKLHGDDDVAYLYRGLYETEAALQEKINHYTARGIERVIVLNGVPEAPDNAAPTNVRLSNGGLEASVKENSPEGTSVAIVIADDDTPDTTGMTFEIFNNDVFGIDAASGEIYVLDKSKLDLEQQQSYTVHVRAKDAGGLYSAWKDVTITLTDENEAADNIAFSDLKNVAVGNDVGTLVAKATAHDPDIYTDAYRVNHYRFMNGTAVSDDGFFEIDPDSGQIKVHNKLTDAGQYSLWIVAYDAQNHVSQAFEYKVVVQDAGNQPPSNVHLTTGGTAFSVDENTDNTTFSHFITADDDKSGSLTYYMDANDLFVIDKDTGQISIKDGAKLDYETNATYTVTVYAMDGEGALSAGQQIQVTINDKNDGPDSVAVNHVADIKVGSGGGIVVAQAAASDVDADPLNRQNHYRFVDAEDPNGRFSKDGLFEIDAQTGEIKTRHDVSQSDFYSHNLKVQAFDQDGHSVETTYTVDVGASDDPGPIPELIDNKTVLEHVRNGTAVGKLLSVNSATGETFSYQLVTGQTEDRFTIDAQGILRVKDGLRLDFEQGRLATVKVLVTSSLHGTFEHDLPITLRNLGTEVVTGGSGNDKIVSGQFSDVLDGGAGNDTLISGLGDDQLTGGDGNDTFVFDQVTFDEFPGVENVDTIMDFNVDHDHIELRQQAFDALDLGVLNVDVFHVGSLDTMTENSRIIYDQEHGDLYYDLDGSGTDFASKKIATFMEDPDTGLRPVLNLSHFLVV